jgi:capsular polysaccharide biosynthesis protein
MPRASVFIFDSSYPSIDIALPIDETEMHVVVSDREVEPPPGHSTLQLEEATGFASLRRNLKLLRAIWHRSDGRKCIVIAVPGMRNEQLLLNSIYALCLCRNVVFFDGVNLRSLTTSWRLPVSSAVRVLGKCALGRVRKKIKTARFDRRTRALSSAATPEARLFGIYNRTRSFSLPLDRVTRQPNGTSIYGSYTRGWYLPALSNHLQRYTVQTTRHRLTDIFLHVEDVGGSSERFLFKDGRILDYPYLLITRGRHNASSRVSTRTEVKSIDRGIDMLHFTFGYYHWLVDGVPRVLDLIDDGIDFDEYPLIMPPLEMFQRELLRILGISPDRHVVIVGKDDWCHVGECIFPTSNFPFAAPGLDDYWTQPNGDALRRVRERILARLPNTNAESKNAPRRLYISRAKAAKRKLTAQSETAVRLILESRGFQTVCLEDLPWDEQILLVSGAEAVVGVHGAGLTNILFAKSLSLLEFQNPLEARAYFAVMARELNMEYAYIVGKLDGRSNSFDNIAIDSEALNYMMNRLNLSS